jgi:hypothetical protein
MTISGRKNKMVINSKVLLYLKTTQAEAVGKKLIRSVREVVLLQDILIANTMDKLFVNLSRPGGEIAATIIVAFSGEELFNFALFRDILLRAPLILILPDHEKKTITKGHALRPRFLSYIDNDFSEVSGVLKKIIWKTTADKINIEHRRLSTIG